MSSEAFKAIATLAQLIFSIVLFIYAYKYLIRPRKRNRKGKYLSFSYRIPKGYFRLPQEGNNFEGVFCKLPLKDPKLTIVIVANRKPINLEERKKELLSPNKDNYQIEFISEGNKSVNGLNFVWLKANHYDIKNSLKLIHITYLYSFNNCYIEIGAGGKREDFDSYSTDYEELVNSIKLLQKG